MSTLIDLTARTLAQSVPPDVAAMAEYLRKSRSGVAAILAYGSCLRGVSIRQSLADFYVLVDRDADVSANALSLLAARLIPPNVYYAEMQREGATLRCKYAVMTLEAFAARMKRTVSNPYFWARFAQPAALVYASDTASRRIPKVIANAVDTMYAASRGTVPHERDPLMIWQRGFEETYRTELRPESRSRAAELVASNADFYRAAAEALEDAPPLAPSWAWRRFTGRLHSILRLAKAAFTFQGAAEYAAWKIERHSGRKIELTAWQRRHPFLAGLLLLPSLLKRRALR